jgi:hypothetical protein
MSTPFEVPLQAKTPQVFTIGMAGTTYTMHVHWCGPAQAWILDIYDAIGTTLLIGGMAMVTGVDLLKPYGYLDIGGALVVQSDQDPDAAPTFENLGKTSHLYFVTP